MKALNKKKKPRDQNKSYIEFLSPTYLAYICVKQGKNQNPE